MIDLKNCRAFTLEPGTPDQRLETLERIVLDLMMEIEALRSAMIQRRSLDVAIDSDRVLDEPVAGVSPPHTAYGEAYLKTAWLSHWSAGPTCGLDKLIEQFYGDEYRGENWDAIRWREMLMLCRLGYSKQQRTQYLESARTAETCT
jgi:hypothetical protein